MTYDIISERTASGRKIAAPSDIYQFLKKKYSRYPQEVFLSISLSASHEVLAIKMVTIGLLNKTLVHPREVFREAIKLNAAAMIICHNHPSGNLDPSPQDKEISRRMIKAGELLNIPVLDHLIFSREHYYSFLEDGKWEGTDE